MFDIFGEVLWIIFDRLADKIASIIVANDLKKEEERKFKELESRIKIIIDGKEV